MNCMEIKRKMRAAGENFGKMKNISMENEGNCEAMGKIFLSPLFTATPPPFGRAHYVDPFTPNGQNPLPRVTVELWSTPKTIHPPYSYSATILYWLFLTCSTATGWPFLHILSYFLERILNNFNIYFTFWCQRSVVVLLDNSEGAFKKYVRLNLSILTPPLHYSFFSHEKFWCMENSVQFQYFLTFYSLAIEEAGETATYEK